MFFLILGYKREHLRVMSTPCMIPEQTTGIFEYHDSTFTQRLCSLKIHTLLGSKETYQTKYK